MTVLVRYKSRKQIRYHCIVNAKTIDSKKKSSLKHDAVFSPVSLFTKKLASGRVQPLTSHL